MEINTATVEISMEKTQKTVTDLSYDQPIPLMGIFPKEWKSVYNGDS